MRGLTNGPDTFLMLVCYLMYAWCAAYFLKTQLRGKSSEAGVFGSLLFCGRGAAFFFLEGKHVPYILYALCCHIALAVLVMVAFHGEKEKRLLAAVVLAAMTGLIWNFIDSFLCCGELVLVNFLAGKRQIVSIGVKEGRIIMLLTYGGGITAVALLSKPVKSIFTGKRKSWYLFLTIALLGIILVTDLVNWAASNGILVRAPERYGLYENQLFSHGAMCMFLGLAMIAAGFLILGMDRLDREEQSREQYRSQVMYYQMMEEQYGQMERLRHDMKNHGIALQNLIQNRQWEQAKDYLSQMAGAGGVEAGDEVTGSLVIDALLYHKRRQASEHGICWQCDARLPADCPVKEMDLCIIVGNALDNALEACLRLDEGEERFVRVYLGTIKKCLFLEVRNSMAPEEKAEKRNPVKGKLRGQGLGIGNIKAAAAEYNGAVSVRTEKGVFSLAVLLPLCEINSTHMT